MNELKGHHRRTDCRLCRGTDWVEVFSLTPTPPANALLTAEQVKTPTEFETRYPLDLFFCKTCKHLQLLDVVDPEILFRNYVYVSGTSPVFVKHFEDYCHSVVRFLNLKPSARVVEIGSNDGTLLHFFKTLGHPVLGIDPAVKIAQEATAKGIETLPVFFDQNQAEKIRHSHGSADLIVANNVFAHMDDLDSVTRGIRSLLSDQGVFVFEVSYLADVIQKTLFDTIYHEHLDYHSVLPLIQFFDRFEMNVFHAERVDSHGGSIRIFAQLNSRTGASRPSTPELGAILENEKQIGLHNEETFRAYSKKINSLGDELNALVRELKRAGKKIAGFGAPAKATTLMHQFGINSETVDFIVDDSPLKQGLFTPGMHIPIVPSTALQRLNPDYLIILAWNFADSIIAKNQAFTQAGGHFIVPLPHLKVI